MTTQAGQRWWRHRRGWLEGLDHGECITLLGAAKVGRLAFATRNGPRIVPMNHAVHDTALWLTTGAGSELARYGIGQTVAYEVDQIDDFLEGGWSVVVVGTLELYQGPYHPIMIEPVPDPWAEGADDVMLQVFFHSVTGRRLHPA